MASIHTYRHQCMYHVYMCNLSRGTYHLKDLKDHLTISYENCYSATQSKNCIFIAQKSCAWFGLNFSIFLLCQMKIPDEKKILEMFNKPLVYFN